MVLLDSYLTTCVHFLMQYQQQRIINYILMHDILFAYAPGRFVVLEGATYNYIYSYTTSKTHPPLSPHFVPNHPFQPADGGGTSSPTSPEEPFLPSPSTASALAAGFNSYTHVVPKCLLRSSTISSPLSLAAASMAENATPTNPRCVSDRQDARASRAHQPQNLTQARRRTNRLPIHSTV